MDQKSQYKARYTKYDRKEIENSLKLIDTGADYMQRAPLAKAH